MSYTLSRSIPRDPGDGPWWSTIWRAVQHWGRGQVRPAVSLLSLCVQVHIEALYFIPLLRQWLHARLVPMPAACRSIPPPFRMYSPGGLRALAMGGGCGLAALLLTGDRWALLWYPVAICWAWSSAAFFSAAHPRQRGESAPAYTSRQGVLFGVGLLCASALMAPALAWTGGLSLPLLPGLDRLAPGWHALLWGLLCHLLVHTLYNIGARLYCWPVASVHSQAPGIPERYVKILFEWLQETPDTQLLVMALTRHLNLTEMLCRAQIPKDQRPFSATDVRDLLAHYDKRDIQLHFLLAKQEILSQRLSAPALEKYEAALYSLLNALTRALGEQGRLQATPAEPASDSTASSSEQDAVLPASDPPSPTQGTAAPPTARRPHQSQAVRTPHRLMHWLMMPLWHSAFAFLSLWGWLEALQRGPFVALMLFTSLTFAIAQRPNGWIARLLVWGLGFCFNLITVFSLTLWTQQALWTPGIPFLPATLPAWLHASLWGALTAFVCHVLYNVLVVASRTFLRGLLPSWVRALPLA